MMWLRLFCAAAIGGWALVKLTGWAIEKLDRYLEERKRDLVTCPDCGRRIQFRHMGRHWDEHDELARQADRGKVGTR